MPTWQGRPPGKAFYPFSAGALPCRRDLCQNKKRSHAKADTNARVYERIILSSFLPVAICTVRSNGIINSNYHEFLQSLIRPICPMCPISPTNPQGTAVQAGLDEVKKACLARLSIPFSAGQRLKGYIHSVLSKLNTKSFYPFFSRAKT